jgi:hypothetical protein
MLDYLINLNREINLKLSVFSPINHSIRKDRSESVEKEYDEAKLVKQLKKSLSIKNKRP